MRQILYSNFEEEIPNIYPPELTLKRTSEADTVYISQLIRISRICDMFQSFVIRNRLLTERLIKQGFCYSKL